MSARAGDGPQRAPQGSAPPKDAIQDLPRPAGPLHQNPFRPARYDRLDAQRQAVRLALEEEKRIKRLEESVEFIGWFLPIKKKLTTGWAVDKWLVDRQLKEARENLRNEVVKLEALAIAGGVLTPTQVEALPVDTPAARRTRTANLLRLVNVVRLASALGDSPSLAPEVELKLNFILDEAEKSGTHLPLEKAQEHSEILLALLTGEEATDTDQMYLAANKHYREEQSRKIDIRPGFGGSIVEKMWLRDP